MMTSWRTVRVAGWATALATLLSVSALSHQKSDWPVPPEARAMKNPVPSSDAALAAAKATYADKCAQCHGAGGKGDGEEAAMYSVKPADLTDAHMMNEMTDGEIFYKITEGRKPMPTYKNQLTDEQRWQLVHYVRTFAPKPAPASEAKKPAKASATKKPVAKKKPAIQQ